MRTSGSPSNMPGLRLVGEDERASALSPFGPQRAGLTATQRTNREVVPLELLRSWERQTQTLESKYLEVLDTLIDVMDRLVRLGAFSKDTTTTEKVVE